MPFTRETFIKKIKKIKTEFCDNKLCLPYASLVELVNKAMEWQVKAYKLRKERYEIQAWILYKRLY